MGYPLYIAKIIRGLPFIPSKDYTQRIIITFYLEFVVIVTPNFNHELIELG